MTLAASLLNGRGGNGGQFHRVCNRCGVRGLRPFQHIETPILTLVMTPNNHAHNDDDGQNDGDKNEEAQRLVRDPRKDAARGWGGRERRGER